MPDAPQASAPAMLVLRSSQAAIDLIVTEEDSGQAYYERHYEHFDWPLGASGPTVGIGYDCGYSTAQQIRQDWTGFVPDQTVAALMRAAGLRGQAAHAWVQRYGSSVTILWDPAMAQFKAHELPKWEARIIAALPNAELLPGDCFGALTSLGFNRGTGGFHDPSSRDVEMRNITSHMATKRFDEIPIEFLHMRRLWPQGGDLWRRRTHEAALFEKGLTAAAPATS
jgi:GH24 family phage-related lysozyme (muramidase)